MNKSQEQEALPAPASPDQEKGERVGPHALVIIGGHPMVFIVALMMFLFPIFEPELLPLPFVATLEQFAALFLVDIAHLGADVATAVARLGLALGICAGVGSYISYRFKAYRLCEYAIIVDSGVLTQNSDTIRYQMVFDCDIQRVMGEKTIGIGTLVIRLINIKSGQPDRRVELSFVNDPEKVRDFILARTPKVNAIASF